MTAAGTAGYQYYQSNCRGGGGADNDQTMLTHHHPPQYPCDIAQIPHHGCAMDLAVTKRYVLSLVTTAFSVHMMHIIIYTHMHIGNIEILLSLFLPILSHTLYKAPSNVAGATDHIQRWELFQHLLHAIS